ncbi:MAG TPA: VOC family protein, partial [Gemmatimonadales bacterium]|nr:VOC family protein [Gemmatimonadales bacterium]
ILNVSSMDESFAWFAKLGWKKLWDWGEPASFGAVANGGGEIFLCLDGQGCREIGGNWMGWFLGSPAEVDAAHAVAVANGVLVTQPPTDFPWNMREFHVRHPDGHMFRIGAGLEEEGERDAEMRAGPPLAIERVAVPVRLEQRLAALLQDLAASKGMSVDSALEEILLHTNEPFRGGVASPHTQKTLALIQQLKVKHGIDYDSHASYRFVERP